MNRRDQLMGLFLLGAAAAAWHLTADLSPLGRLFPRAAAAAIAVLSLVLIGRGFFPEQEERPVEAIIKSNWLLSFAGILAYIVAIPYLGFTLASCLFLSLASWTLGTRNLLASVAGAVLISLVFYGVFHHLFAVPLPPGRLFGI